MDKQELLRSVTTLAKQKLLRREELLEAFEKGREDASSSTGKQVSIAEVLSYIGGAIVFLGISTLIYQNWTQLSGFTKILSTLGSGIAAYIVGVAFLQARRMEHAAVASFFLSAIVLPLGLFITFDQAGFQTSSAGTNALVSAVLAVAFLASAFAFRKNLFLFFAIIFCSWLFYALTSELMGSNPIFDRWKFYEYRTLVVGISYLLLGYSFIGTVREELTGFLYGFGILGFLGAALGLGGWSPSHNIFWELLFPGLAIATVFLGVPLRSKTFFVFGAIFLMLYILKITSEYFAHSLGWPFALVIAGLGMMAIGIATYTISKRSLSASATSKSGK